MSASPPSVKSLDKANGPNIGGQIEGSNDVKALPAKIPKISVPFSLSPKKVQESIDTGKVPAKIPKKPYSFAAPSARKVKREQDSDEAWRPQKQGKTIEESHNQRPLLSHRSKAQKSTQQKPFSPVLERLKEILPKQPLYEAESEGSHGPGQKDSINKVVEITESTPAAKEDFNFGERVGLQDLERLKGSQMLNDTVILALLHHLVSNKSCMIIDSLELDGDSQQLPSEQRQHEARSASRILMPYHQRILQHWLLFVYSPRSKRLESFDSLGNNIMKPCPIAVRELLSKLLGYEVTAELVRRSCAEQTNGVDCGIHVVHNAHQISSGDKVPMTVNGTQLRENYHALLSDHHSPIIRNTPKQQDVLPREPSYSPTNILHHSFTAEKSQTDVRTMASEKYRSLVSEFEDARANLRALEGLGGAHLVVEDQVHNAHRDCTIAENLLASAVAAGTEMTGRKSKEYLNGAILPMLNGWSTTCRGTWERRKREHERSLKEKESADGEIEGAWKKLQEARKGVEGWEEYVARL